MNLTEGECYADSMAFFQLQTQPPRFDSAKRPRLSLAHLTSVPPFGKDFNKALHTHREFRAQALSNPDTHEVRTREDLNKPGMGLLFGLQHAPEGLTFQRVCELYHWGIRSMGIAYDGPSEYGDGFKNPGGRLTDRGKDLLTWMCLLGIIPDLSHAGFKTACDALDFVAKARYVTHPMASHSACQSAFSNPRNIQDPVLDGIADLDGYVGIPAITFFLGHKDSDYMENVVHHVVSAAVMMRRENVGIGSDCNHLDMTMEEARAHYENMTKNIVKSGGEFGEYFPDRPPELILHGSRMFEILEQKLLEMFAGKTVRGFCGQNFRAFLDRSLPSA